MQMDLRRLRIGKNDISVDALKAALVELESGLGSRLLSVRSIRLGQLPSLNLKQKKCISYAANSCSECTLLPGSAPVYITHLILTQNGIGCSGMLSIAIALSRMRCLMYLDLSGNKLSYIGWNALAHVLAASKYLLELHLSGNFIGHNDPVPDAETSPQSPGRGSPVQLNLPSAQVEGMSASLCLKSLHPCHI